MARPHNEHVYRFPSKPCKNLQMEALYDQSRPGQSLVDASVILRKNKLIELNIFATLPIVCKSC